MYVYGWAESAYFQLPDIFHENIQKQASWLESYDYLPEGHGQGDQALCTVDYPPSPCTWRSMTTSAQ